MKIKPAQYAQALYEMVQADPKAAEASCRNFFIFLRRQGQLKLLPQILRELEFYHQKLTNEVRLDIILARPLVASDFLKIIKNLEEILKIKINPQLRIDKSLAGGLKVKGRDILIDGSISGILNFLKSF